MNKMFAEFEKDVIKKKQEAAGRDGCLFTDTSVRSYFYLPTVMRNISEGASKFSENTRPRGVLSSVCI